MNKENLKERLAYFEQKLQEAKRKSAAKEPHPRNFDAGYTTETFKTWVESIAVINERISRIKGQLGSPDLQSSSTRSGSSPR